MLAPIFDGGRLEGEMGGVATRRDQAAFVYRKTVLNAFREVQQTTSPRCTSTFSARTMAARRDALSRRCTMPSGATRPVTRRTSERSTAQRNLFNAELSLIQVRAESMSGVALYLALGGSSRQRR